MIISGGVNIYPQECENVLVTHPKVLDAAVFGVPNEDLGEEVKAVVQVCDPSEAGVALEEKLIAFCRQHLSATNVHARSTSRTSCRAVQRESFTSVCCGIGIGRGAAVNWFNSPAALR